MRTLHGDCIWPGDKLSRCHRHRNGLNRGSNSRSNGKVKDLDKGLDRTITTNDAGLYDTGPIVPEDHYTITYTKAGFSTYAARSSGVAGRRIGMNMSWASDRPRTGRCE